MAVKKIKDEVQVNIPETEVNVDVTSVEETKPEVTVEVKNTTVEPQKTSQKFVRVRMRQDHKCYIAGELYDLKKGICYNVPMSVKFILNKAGVLSPL